jgi:hypothetical protein
MVFIVITKPIEYAITAVPDLERSQIVKAHENYPNQSI